MRLRLREMPTPEELAKLYATPHDHMKWVDHRYRVDVTAAIAGQLMREGGTVADLSCGNAAIAERLLVRFGGRAILGDFAPGYDLTGPIEETIDQVRPVDLFILSETLEHLDDPDAVLRKIRAKTTHLVLSTPDGEDNNWNPEHVWGWDSEAVKDMLQQAGFTPIVHTIVDSSPLGGYVYQIWACR